jgi:hypothetical protein
MFTIYEKTEAGYSQKAGNPFRLSWDGKHVAQKARRIVLYIRQQRRITEDPLFSSFIEQLQPAVQWI